VISAHFFVLISVTVGWLIGCGNAPIMDLPTRVATVVADVAPTTEPTALISSAETATTPIIPTPAATPTNTPNPLVKVATALPPTSTPIPCPTNGTTIPATYASTIEGPTRTYRIYLPPCYETETRRYPTLYLLHGNAYGAEEWDNIGIDEEADRLILAQEIAPVIIVMPEGRSLSDFTSGGDYSYEAVLVNELIPHVDAVYRTNKQRAIGGLSRGGYWAAEVAFRHPDLFTSVGLHAPVFLDTGDDTTINPLWTVESADITPLCIAIDFGAEDIYVNTALPIRNALLARQIPHRWTIYPDGNHQYPYWTVHRTDYIRWYMEQWKSARCT
jgi:enterochelin esterase-like enzyme